MTTAKVEVVYKNTLDSLFKAVGDQRTPQLLEKLARHGLTYPTLPAQLERAPWNAVLREVSATLFPGEAEDVAHFRLGRSMMDHLKQSLAGKAQAAMARILGPHRVLELFRNTLSTGGNYSETKVTREGERAVSLWINESGEQHPAFFAGLLTAALELTGATQVDVKLRSLSATEGAVYGVTWR